jgi:glutathione S-transferase
MPRRILVIGNKNYSSWSLRPWLALRMAGIDFEELRIPLYLDHAKQAILAQSPAGKVPVLREGDLRVHESLAICEYAAELAPAAQPWPADAAARAHARSISAEMHAGFAALRASMPMNVRVEGGRLATPLGDAARADVQRLATLLEDCRDRFGAGGPFLFGRFGIADAMFAPVASRFRTYSVPLPPRAQAWADAVLATEPMQQWTRDARSEAERVPYYDSLLASG